jgi:hypothetical protein
MGFNYAAAPNLAPRNLSTPEHFLISKFRWAERKRGVPNPDTYNSHSQAHRQRENLDGCPPFTFPLPHLVPLPIRNLQAAILRSSIALQLLSQTP